MKKATLISASLLLAFTGCGFGQGPNIFTRMHNRIHGVSNVGAPCVNCEEPVHHGCDNCGSTTSGYGGYDGTVIDSYDSTPIVSSVQGSAPISYNTTAPTYSTPAANPTNINRQYGSEGVISKPSR